MSVYMEIVVRHNEPSRFPIETIFFYLLNTSIVSYFSHEYFNENLPHLTH